MGSVSQSMPGIPSFLLFVRKLLFSRKDEILSFPVQRHYSICYGNDVDEEAFEAFNLTVIKNISFDDIEEFWFDNNLNDQLSEHLLLDQAEIQDVHEEVEDVSFKTHYVLDCERETILSMSL